MGHVVIKSYHLSVSKIADIKMNSSSVDKQTDTEVNYCISKRIKPRSKVRSFYLSILKNAALGFEFRIIVGSLIESSDHPLTCNAVGSLLNKTVQSFSCLFMTKDRELHVKTDDDSHKSRTYDEDQ